MENNNVELVYDLNLLILIFLFLITCLGVYSSVKLVRILENEDYQKNRHR